MNLPGVIRVVHCHTEDFAYQFTIGARSVLQVTIRAPDRVAQVLVLLVKYRSSCGRW